MIPAATLAALIVHRERWSATPVPETEQELFARRAREARIRRLFRR